MSYSSRMPRTRRSYDDYQPKDEAGHKLQQFFREIRDAIQKTPSDELTEKRFSSSGARLKHPASQSTLDKLRSMVRQDIMEDAVVTQYKKVAAKLVSENPTASVQRLTGMLLNSVTCEAIPSLAANVISEALAEETAPRNANLEAKALEIYNAEPSATFNIRVNRLIMETDCDSPAAIWATQMANQSAGIKPLNVPHVHETQMDRVERKLDELLKILKGQA